MEHLADIFRQADFELSAAQCGEIQQYTALLQKWNKKIRLTAIDGEEEIYRQHFLESFLVARFLPREIARLLDVGSGAGFPGLALKILYPRTRITLVESSQKKARFLEEVARALGWHGAVEVCAVRFEDFDPTDRGFDVVTVRGVHLTRQTMLLLEKSLSETGWLAVVTGDEKAAELRSAGTGFLWEDAKSLRPYSARWLLLGQKRST